MVETRRPLRLILTGAVILGMVAGCAPVSSPSPAATPATVPKSEAKSSPPTPVLQPLTPTPKASAGQPKYGGSVTRIRENYPDMLDPHFSRGAAWWGDVLAPLYNGLFALDEKMEIVPDLVEKWEQPSDTVYVLRLRQGVKFHDSPTMKGHELTAEDVKFNIQRMGTNDPKFFRRWQFQLVSSVEIVDKYTVRITLKEPTAPFMDFLALPMTYMVGREAVEKFGDLNREEAGTGPFYLKSWTEKISYKLARNPNYFVKGVPYLDEVNVIVVPDSATRLAAFRAGRADYLMVSNTDFESLKKTNARITSSSVPRNQVFLVFHPEKKPFDDQRVRQAFSLAVDRQAIIDVVMDGEAELTSPIFGAAASWRLPIEELKRLYKPDTGKAKQLLAEAGFPNGLSLEIKVSSRRTECVDALAVVANQLKQVGITVKQQPLEHTTLIAHRAGGDYTAILHVGTPALEVGERVTQYWRARGEYRIEDKQVADLLEQQMRAVDTAKRRQLLNQFERVMIEKAYAVFLFGYGERLARQPHVKGPPEPSFLSQHLVAYQWIDK
ncbi:MAG: ABC transporter substrate-binding protein [Chloroflexi bacterium]|nr:ABC transporter substrate-binding protein [Chloroflexota bacterium]